MCCFCFCLVCLFVRFVCLFVCFVLFCFVFVFVFVFLLFTHYSTPCLKVEESVCNVLIDYYQALLK